MMLEEGEIITIEGRDFIAVNVLDINNKTYTFLVSSDEPLETKIASVDVINGNYIISELSNKEEIDLVLKKVSETEV